MTPPTAQSQAGVGDEDQWDEDEWDAALARYMKKQKKKHVVEERQVGSDAGAQNTGGGIFYEYILPVAGLVAVNLLPIALSAFRGAITTAEFVGRDTPLIGGRKSEPPPSKPHQFAGQSIFR